MEMSLHYVDFSSFSQEEAISLQKVLLRQKEFEELNGIRRRDLKLELLQLEEQLFFAEKSATDKQLCKICFKTKVAECLRLCCKFCTRKTCSKCGNREFGTMNWLCLLCFKKRHYLTSTGDWYVGNESFSTNTQFFLDKLGQNITSSTTDHLVIESCQGAANDNGMESTQSLSSRISSEEDANADSCIFCNEPEYLSLPVPDEPRRRSEREFSTESEYTSCFSVSTISDIGMPALNVVNPTDSENDSSDNLRDKKAGIGKRSKKEKRISSKAQRRGVIERLSLPRKVTSRQSASKPFGVCIVGGKTSIGGVLGAFVVEVIPGTKAEDVLSIGDQVIEWNNISLIDATFEHTHEAMTSSSDHGDVYIVVCHVSTNGQSNPAPRPSCSQLVSDAIEERRACFAREARSCNSQDELQELILSRPGNNRSSSMSTVIKASDEISPHETIWSSSCGNHKSGLKISLWHDPEGLNLIVKILEAQRVPLGNTPGNEIPNPYAVVNLLPSTNVSTQLRTDVKYQTQSPAWNLTFIYSNITEEELSSKSLHVTLWSENKSRRHRFLGKIKVDLIKKVLSNVPQWFYFEDHSVSVDEIAIPVNRRHTISLTQDVIKSFVDILDVLEYSEITKMRARSSTFCSSQFGGTVAEKFSSNVSEKLNKRRTSSVSIRPRTRSLSPRRLLSVRSILNDQGNRYRARLSSENLNVSRPGLVRNEENLVVPSNKSAPCFNVLDKLSNRDNSLPHFDYMYNYPTPKGDVSMLSVGSSCSSRTGFNPGLSTSFEDEDFQEDRVQDESKEEEDEVEPDYERQKRVSKTDKVFYSVEQEPTQKPIAINLRESQKTDCGKRNGVSLKLSEPSLEECSSTLPMQGKLSADLFSFDEDPELGTIGPCQICCHNDQDVGYLQIGLSIMCGSLDVDIIRAKLQLSSCAPQPDTYVKTYLIYDDKKLMKRKSSTVRQDLHPIYNCNIKYEARNADNKILNVCIWQNNGVFGRNAPLGEVHISLDRLNFSGRLIAWYKLFPIPKLT